MSSPKPTVSDRPQRRVLACVLCQQRKIRCNRDFPCSNCARAGAHCVPGTLAKRQRRRRYPERELLLRLRHYESLLLKNDIQFEPLHPSHVDQLPSAEDVGGSDSRDELSANDQPRIDAESESNSMDRQDAINRKGSDPTGGHDRSGDNDYDNGFLHDNDQVRQSVIKKAWDHAYEGEMNDHLLFGPPRPDIPLATLHPARVHIFRLWQIYSENIDPLLKVTHTPTFQSRIIDAASDVSAINPTTEALMFGIYCVSVLSLTDDECSALFNSSRKDLLASYQFGCQQALRNCRVLGSSDSDCLTALYLYLISIRPDSDPRYLNSMLGIAVRVAQRIGLHKESTYKRYDFLDAEMSRRLWWSLVIFDNRICEMFNHDTSALVPMWDCRVPLNLNDFEMRPEMKSRPQVHEGPTEAIFAVVRSELADFVRHNAFRQESTDTGSGEGLYDSRGGSELDTVEKKIEDQYLSFCNADNPLQFMTIWTSRSHIAKLRLLHHCREQSKSPMQTSTNRGTAVSYALRIIECDTKLTTSPLTRGYLWLTQFYFPFPAYVHILQDMTKGPDVDYADKAWQFMGDNYKVRIKETKQSDRPFFILLSRIVLQAWDVREGFLRRKEIPFDVPFLVSDIREKVMQMTLSFTTNRGVSCADDPMSMALPLDPVTGDSFDGTEGLSATGSGTLESFGITEHLALDNDLIQPDTSAMTWNTLCEGQRLPQDSFQDL